MRGARVVWPLAVGLVGAAVYANTLSNGFALDDVPLVRDNAAVRSLARLPRLLAEPYWPPEMGGAGPGLYRPVTLASLAVNRALTGAEPLGFHWGNLLLHAWVSVLAWYAAKGSGGHYGTACVAGLVFAVHPLHVEAVAPVTGRAELLGAFWVLAAWIAHRKAAGGRPAGWSVAAGLALLLAVLSKENTALAPLLFLLDDRWQRRGIGMRAARAWGPYAVYATMLAAGMALRVAVLGGLRGAGEMAFIDNPAAFAGTASRVATALWVQAKYAWLFLSPIHLSSDYSYDAIPVITSAADLRLAAGLLWAVAWLGLLWIGWRRSRPLALAAGLWGLFFLPSSNLLFPAGTAMAERLSYLPSLGGCLALGHLAAWAGSRIAAARPQGPARTCRLVGLATLVAAVVGLLAWRTIARNPVWRDNESLALHDVRVMPRSAKLQAGAGIALHARGRYLEAEAAYREALAIYPEYAQIHYNLGSLLLRRQANVEAIEHLQRAAALSPQNPGPPKSLAPLLEQAGRLDEALEFYARATDIDPGDLGLRFNHGRALLAAGRPADARTVLAALAHDDPRGIAGGLALALLAESEGRVGQARTIYGELLGRPGLPADIRERVERRRTELAPSPATPPPSR